MPKQYLPALANLPPKTIVAYSLLAFGLTLVLASVLYPNITQKHETSYPKPYDLSIGYCQSRTTQCTLIHAVDETHDCTKECKPCLEVSEASYYHCVNA